MPRAYLVCPPVPGARLPVGAPLVARRLFPPPRLAVLPDPSTNGETAMHDETRRRAFLAHLWAEPIHGPPACEDWRDLMRRLSRAGTNERICEEVYQHF